MPPLCTDGFLAGEIHEQGPSFTFDGRVIGEEGGVYRLVDREYRWESDHPNREYGRPSQNDRRRGYRPRGCRTHVQDAVYVGGRPGWDR